MDTTERRLTLASLLETVADKVRFAHTAEEFEEGLEVLHLIGRDLNGYHARTLEARFDLKIA
jgi:hypothetical protein